jgi:hypothetical protein
LRRTAGTPEPENSNDVSYARRATTDHFDTSSGPEVRIRFRRKYIGTIRRVDFRQVAHNLSKTVTLPPGRLFLMGGTHFNTDPDFPRWIEWRNWH